MSPSGIEKISGGLERLNERVRQDLRWLDLPTRPWVPQQSVDRQQVIDVAVVGAGMAGLRLLKGRTMPGRVRVRFLEGEPYVEPVDIARAGPQRRCGHGAMARSSGPSFRTAPGSLGICPRAFEHTVFSNCGACQAYA